MKSTWQFTLYKIKKQFPSDTTTENDLNYSRAYKNTDLASNETRSATNPTSLQRQTERFLFDFLLSDHKSSFPIAWPRLPE